MEIQTITMRTRQRPSNCVPMRFSVICPNTLKGSFVVIHPAKFWSTIVLTHPSNQKQQRRNPKPKKARRKALRAGRLLSPVWNVLKPSCTFH